MKSETRETRAWNHWTVWGSLAAVIAAAVAGAFADGDDHFAGAASAVTIVGALLAVGVYALNREAERKIDVLVRQITQNDLSDGKGEAPVGTTPVPGGPANLGCVLVAGKHIPKVDPKHVPLRVYGDLLDLWRLEGRTGRWAPADVTWVVRNKGKGNHPWVFQFDGDEDLFRVAYGGAGNTGEKGTATRFKPPDDLDPNVPCP